MVLIYARKVHMGILLDVLEALFFMFSTMIGASILILIMALVVIGIVMDLYEWGHGWWVRIRQSFSKQHVNR